MRVIGARPIAAACAALALLLVAAVPASAAPAVNGIFPVKGIDTNSKIAVGPDGNMWVTLAGAENNVARITPAGAVTEFELGLNSTSGIVTGPEGKLWVTATNELVSFSAADPKNTVSKTMINPIAGVSPIVVGPDNNLWVASKDVVLRIPPAAPATSTSFAVGELEPKDIDVLGSLLAVSDSGAKKRIETVTTAGGLGEIPLPGASQGLAAGPAGQLGFSVPGAEPEQVGLVTPPAAAAFSELGGEPFGVALGVDEAYWIAQFTPGGVTRMTTTGAKTFIPGLPKESPRQIAAGPGNTVWVTLSKAGEEGVARISGLEPPVAGPPAPPPASPPAPETKIGKGPSKTVKTTHKRAKVSFRFSSTSAGATFQCALTKLKQGKKAPAPKYAGCKSPRSYKLVPGRYSFLVRAVNAGIADPTAASSRFKVIRVRPRAG